jgi:methyltransferase of ATP-grasp peptide maturase system
MNGDDIAATESVRSVLKRRLADSLAIAGDLRTPPWRQAVESVARDRFLTSFFRPIHSPTETLWEPVTGDLIPEATRLELVYSDETWVTQLNQRITPDEIDGPVAGIPTSSSTLPGLVIRMLEELQVDDGARVLEIGTGTGYSTALLAERLGSEGVTSVEFDSAVAERAAAALLEAGYVPTLVTGDGLDGYPAGALYDRIIATCSVRRIPGAWIDQTRPGGLILTTLTGWLDASAGLLRLEVTGEGTAQGRFLGTTDSFMPARSHDRRPLPDDLFDWLSETPTDERPTPLGPDSLDQTVDWTIPFIAQLAVSGAQPISISEGDGPMIDYLIDVEQRAFAALIPQPDRTWRVGTAGPIDLWAQVENAVGLWQAGGSPPLSSFDVTVTPAEQSIRLNSPTGPILGALPLDL